MKIKIVALAALISLLSGCNMVSSNASEYTLDSSSRCEAAKVLWIGILKPDMRFDQSKNAALEESMTRDLTLSERQYLAVKLLEFVDSEQSYRWGSFYLGRVSDGDQYKQVRFQADTLLEKTVSVHDLYDACRVKFGKKK